MEEICTPQVRLPMINVTAPFNAEVEIDKQRGIYPSGFFDKELGRYAINAALNCEVKCLFCSSDAVLGRLESYREEVGNWWSCDTAVHYGNIVEKVQRDAKRMHDKSDEVVFSSVVDPYQARLVAKGIPRAILDALAPTQLRVRILTKLPRVAHDLPFIADKFGERATIGTSVSTFDTATARVVEPGAPAPVLRLEQILGRARELGLRRFVMACPVLPGVYADYAEFADAWSAIVDLYEPEKIWFEPLNARGKNIDKLEDGLSKNGVQHVLERVRAIRSNEGWTAYNADLLAWVQRFARERFDVSRVRYLMYERALTKGGRVSVASDGACVVWL
jgi:DNA repair photolyase